MKDYSIEVSLPIYLDISPTLIKGRAIGDRSSRKIGVVSTVEEAEKLMLSLGEELAQKLSILEHKSFITREITKLDDPYRTLESKRGRFGIAVIDTKEKCVSSFFVDTDPFIQVNHLNQEGHLND